MEKNFKDLFITVIEAPSNEELITGIKSGVEYCYVSASYLNGLINYTDIIGGVMINRYLNNSDFNKSIKRIEKFIKNGIHTNVSSCFDYDDILVLSKTKDMYIYFWSDRDVSDCCIGGIDIKSFKSDEEAYKSFLKMVSNLDCIKEKRYYEIPKEFFKGWITL